MAHLQYSLIPVFDRFADGEQHDAHVVAFKARPAKKARKPRRAPQNVADSQ